MKRIFTLITAALLALILCTACGAKNVDLNAVMDSINANVAPAGVTSIENADDLQRYYQIAADDVKQFAAEMTSASSEDYTEVILIEAADSDAADAVATQLNAHLTSLVRNAKSYSAEQVAMLQECEVKQNGNYVYLAIGNNHTAVEAEIEEALK